MTSGYLAQVTGPASTPVSVSEAKLHCRVDGSDDDTLIADLIETAVAFTSGPDGVTGLALITQTWDSSIDSPNRYSQFDFPLVPVQSVNSISYYDADNTLQAANVADFELFRSGDRAWLEPKPGKSWPQVYARPNAITVRFVAGYGEADAVPANIKQAILLLVCHWYQNREAVGANGLEVPMSVEALLSLSRVGWVA